MMAEDRMVGIRELQLMPQVHIRGLWLIWLGSDDLRPHIGSTGYGKLEVSLWRLGQSERLPLDHTTRTNGAYSSAAIAEN